MYRVRAGCQFPLRLLFWLCILPRMITEVFELFFNYEYQIFCILSNLKLTVFENTLMIYILCRYIILVNVSYNPSCYITSSYCLYITWIAKYVPLCGCSCAWIWKVDPVKLHVRQVHCCVTHLIVSLGAPQRDIFLAHFNRLSFHS